MGSMENPKTWVPYMNNEDCSKMICNLYCPQWCNYIILPSPPPPTSLPGDDDAGGATFSPLVIVILSVLGSAILLISYYLIISRYCVGNNESSESSTTRRVVTQETLDLEIEEDEYNLEDDPPSYAPWHVSGKGLDVDVINSIRACKYKKGDNLVLSTDCSVCLGEFQEDDGIRLLPKCSHAFHVHCIDTWLTNHSNCPLCRANVSCTNAMQHIVPSAPAPAPAPAPTVLPSPPLPPPLEISENNETLGGSRNDGGNMSRRVTSDLGSGRDVVIEIREDGRQRVFRRSMSMGYLCQTRVSVADVLFVNQEEYTKLEECQFEHDEGSSKRDMNCVNVGMKRSFSSERYLFTGGWKGKNNGVFPPKRF